MQRPCPGLASCSRAHLRFPPEPVPRQHQPQRPLPLELTESSSRSASRSLAETIPAPLDTAGPAVPGLQPVAATLAFPTGQLGHSPRHLDMTAW